MHSDDGRSTPPDPSFDGTATSSGSDGATVSGFDDADTAFASGDGVPSLDMDDNESDVTGELDIPVPPDQPTPPPATPDPGFDGWLDDDVVTEDSPVDPYASLSDDDDDAAAEIADWMAFTGSGGAEPPVETTPEPPAPADVPEATPDEEPAEIAGFAVVEEIEEPEPVVAVEREAVEPAPEAPVEHEIVEPAPEAPVEHEIVEPVPEAPVEEDDDDGDEDTVEFFLDGEDAGETNLEGLEAWSEPAESDPVPAAAPSPLDFPIGEDDGTTQPPADPERLRAIPVVPIGTTGASQGGNTGEIPPTPAPSGDATVFDYEEDDLTSEHYLHAATREHHELAAAVTAARGTDTEQVAISAAIPGLDSAVVGFGDVVDAEGMGGAPVAAKTPRSSDLFLRVGTAAALIIAFVLSLVWRPAIIVLALAVFVIAAGEFYSVLLHRHYKPLSIFGFLGILGAGLGTVVWGVVAIPIALILMVTVVLLFNAVSRHREGSVTGVSLTVLVAAWIGGFGAFAFPIIASDDYKPLVITVVGMVALVDIAAYGVGRSIGRRPFAPHISPKKTLEGFLGGTLMALLAGSAASFFVSAIDLPAGLVLGVVIAIFAPLGDLSVSVVKRSLDIKDMGSILPGHGGLLDRIDAIIAVIPAAWAALMWLGIL